MSSVDMHELRIFALRDAARMLGRTARKFGLDPDDRDDIRRIANRLRARARRQEIELMERGGA